MNTLPVRSLWRKARALLGETRCVSCHAPVPGGGESPEAPFPRYFCHACRPALPRRTGGHCTLCGELIPLPGLPPAPCGDCLVSPPSWDAFIFYGEYAGLLRELVLRFKTRGELPLGPGLASLLLAHPDLTVAHGRVVAPMPLHPGRIMERGFNQALELARPFAAQGFAVDHTLLARVKDNPPQRGLSREERRRNIRGIFRASPECEGRRILLLDDVCTTGATLREAASALREAGAARVDVAVLARTPPSSPLKDDSAGQPDA